MFNSNNFARINDVIDQMTSLISEHNKLSYKKLSFQINEIDYNLIKPKDDNYGKDPLSKELISFYGRYTGIAYTIHDIETLIKETSYTPDDLSMKIDLSTDSIINLATKLMDNHEKLTDAFEKVKSLANQYANDFINYVMINDPTDLNDFIKVLFICMKQEGLGKTGTIDETLRPFIIIGTKLISVLMRLMNDDHKQLIETEMNECKKIIFGVKESITSLKINKLQSFGLVPDEGSLQPLHSILNDIFGFNMKEEVSIDLGYNSIEKILKLSVADTGRSTGIIIFISSNKDIFFDMTPLYAMNKSLGSKGVDENMINTFNIIRKGEAPKAKKDDMILINVNQKTDLAYCLWTNNYLTFKSRRAPINNIMINKLLRKSPSAIIEGYNQVFENMIQSNRLNDAIMFNKVKYMTFTKETGEEDFLNELVGSLVNVIHSHVQKNNSKLIIDEAFSESLFNVLDESKSKLGISAVELPSHCHIIFGNVASKIVGKLKKELLSAKVVDKQSEFKKSIEDIVKLVVCSNDNIYSRTIASYYLHIA